MGASEIASGRNPSMDRISTREARGWGMGIGEAVDVGAGVPVGVDVAVCITVGGTVEVATAGNGAAGFGIWQARRITSTISGNSFDLMLSNLIQPTSQWQVVKHTGTS
jgi:hypothetical protein